MDFELPEDLKLLGNQLRRFVDQEIIPIELDACDGPDLRPNVRAVLEEKTRELGYWHMFTPTEYGGMGMGLLARVVVWEQMGRTIALPTRKPQIFGPEASPLLYHLNEEQKKEYLIPVIEGKKRTCFGLTEPNAGSDPSGIISKATRRGDSYVIDGYKRYISNAENADFIQLLVKVVGAEQGKAFTLFLVDMKSPGVKIVRAEKTMMDDTPCEIAFDNVMVPASNRVGDEGDGFKYAQDWINVGRLKHGARALGVIDRCLTLSTRYAKQRHTFGKPLSERQSIQWMLVDSYMAYRQLKLSVYSAALRYDRGEDIRNDAYLVKIVGDKAAFEAADRCMQIHGGIAFTKDLPIEKFWRDQRSMMITEGPEEVLRVALAKHVLSEFG